MNDLKMTARLKRVLSRNHAIRFKIMALPKKNIRISDQPFIQELSNEVKTYLRGNDILLRDWKKTERYLLRVLKYGYDIRMNTVIAYLLTGAAFEKRELNLRRDLSATLLQDVKIYQRGPASFTALPEHFQTAINCYKKLKSSIPSNGKIDKAIDTLLQDNTKGLRVGYNLHTLNPIQLQRELKKLYTPEPVHIAGPVREGNGQQERSSTSPTKIDIKIKNFKCEKSQENSDEIFWLGWTYRLKNLVQVYNDIDRTIKSGSLDEIDLKMDWERTSWQSDLYTGMVDNKVQNLNHTLISNTIYRGFCPWMCSFLCIEDDEELYNEVAETIDAIGDVAEVISKGASTVASVSGPTVVAAGAAAVASVSGLVSLTADIAEGIVSIVNNLDTNDTIGSVSFIGNRDHIGMLPTRIPNRPPISQTQTAKSSRDGGIYDLTTELRFSGREQFNRTWRYKYLRTKRKRVHRTNTLCCGGSGNVNITLKFSEKVHALANKGVDYHREGNARHAEWNRRLVLQADKIRVKGRTHWGVRACNDIDYYPWVTGLKFTVNL